eukprot:CAMPEP_0179173248 /NCGR_PEP_ID=MMETSP0796-20121207/85483_1 /TAXON_ID=73915 /ORGANISM="Pyrodinium bahamense, Strain pbaha01" /LENGTH=196 /DNA_ID=CAMNT_0020876455 /DNA_START=25 /DNA_END=612 /DNA_ORIENTATION=+
MASKAAQASQSLQSLHAPRNLAVPPLASLQICCWNLAKLPFNVRLPLWGNDAVQQHRRSGVLHRAMRPASGMEVHVTQPCACEGAQGRRAACFLLSEPCSEQRAEGGIAEEQPPLVETPQQLEVMPEIMPDNDGIVQKRVGSGDGLRCRQYQMRQVHAKCSGKHARATSLAAFTGRTETSWTNACNFCPPVGDFHL